MLLALAPVPASAQVYELIGACKRSVGVQIACIVVEKVGERIVEKKAQEWWDHWVAGDGKKAAAPSPAAPAAGRSQRVSDIALTGHDYRVLMREFDATLGRAPRGLSDARFVELLGASCGPTGSTLVCREFRPLFPRTGAQPDCRSLKDERACATEPRCRWRLNLCVLPTP